MTRTKRGRRESGSGPSLDRRPWLLVVIDDRGQADLARVLEAEYRLLVAATTSQALTQLDRARFDLVLLDLAIETTLLSSARPAPGLQLLRSIRERRLLQPGSGRPLPVVALTSHVDGLRAAVTVLVDHGANDLLPKPIDPPELLERLRRALIGQAALAPVTERGAGELRVAFDLERRCVLLETLPPLGGRVFDLLQALHDPATPRDDEGFVPSKVLWRRLGVLEPSLHRLVLRVRNDLRAAFAGHLRRDLGPEQVVESARWSGYRLNPHHIRVVEASELQPAADGAGGVQDFPSHVHGDGAPRGGEFDARRPHELR